MNYDIIKNLTKCLKNSFPIIGLQEEIKEGKKYKIFNLGDLNYFIFEYNKEDYILRYKIGDYSGYICILEKQFDYYKNSEIFLEVYLEEFKRNFNRHYVKCQINLMNKLNQVR